MIQLLRDWLWLLLPLLFIAIIWVMFVWKCAGDASRRLRLIDQLPFYMGPEDLDDDLLFPRPGHYFIWRGYVHGPFGFEAEASALMQRMLNTRTGQYR